MKSLKSFTWVLAAATALAAAPAFAQLGNGQNPECLGSQCGTPKEEGGGCGCGCGCSVWVAYTDDGKTLAYTDDADGDGKSDDKDNCPFASNRDQNDVDGDGIGDVCDNCNADSNVTQIDTDGDGSGDTCDTDDDGDGHSDVQDNCSTIPNVAQTNSEVTPDAQGDVCDSDDDNDGFADAVDTCPLIANADQSVLPSGTCKTDSDADNVGDSWDNCPAVKNPTQADADGDGQGDVCDADMDNDGVINASDNCNINKNRDQIDDDGDGAGDLCDAKYCVVVDPSNADDCLDPNGAFKVHGGGSITLKKGEKFRLPLFANRNGVAIEYKWTVTKAPNGSTAKVENAEGAVSLSRHWEYRYPSNSVPSFTADADGAFVIQLSAKLAFTDRIYSEPEAQSSTSELRMTATPDGKPGTPAASCAAAGLGAPLFGLALLALSMRRRRQ